MTPEQRIERFFEKYYPLVKAEAKHHEGKFNDLWQQMANDMVNLRHPTAEGDTIDYQI